MQQGKASMETYTQRLAMLVSVLVSALVAAAIAGK